MSPDRPVTLIGAGNMGGAMAAHLLAQGWTVEVCDIDRPKVDNLKRFGAVALDLPAQAAMNSIAFMVCVVDAAQTETVLFGEDGLARMLQPGHVVMLCPTLAPEDVEAFAGRLAARGVHAVDAPMSGGPARARDGTMSLMVACENAVFDRLSDLLQALSGKVFRISEKPGDAARTKLVNNLLAGINLVGAAEALALAARLGLDLARTLEVIEQSSGQSWIGSDRMHRALAGDFAPRAHVTLLEKDTRLALACARAAGFEGPLGGPASRAFAQASAAGLATLDDAALFTYLSRREP
ncbi:MAG: hydroxyacid dehydrogenase [Polaromonas sp. 39-63-203]|jgi:3-hydroxyisobutyrate dehydrogenase|uniref:NAD(P)-dependent oxidoreductase n=1 Tax=Polaromonas sp. TaxID=1869339 RepID=UPI000BCA2584|nr:NAD(P)-dependent oxidoreductase [Polaromonas sp.]OYY50901.1 MAG: hydroxyacid dehydrogenase [Polaromonas sp. 35-63-240]OZA97004.1 MAG: hydroxyacid dehydrogenase [Polaromonas sp. 39-63-203]HQS33615.1 NAD(P)-dependent oxidoreductase [Polaromonas sp.]HQS92861.1 NAD(P)-dependent oxidoreductase [Polaromonas sp.]